MRQRSWKTSFATLAILLLAAGAAAAQEDPRAAAEAERARAEAQRVAAEAERAEAERRLEEARARLEEAAREIAELTIGAMGDAGIVIRSEIDDIRRPAPVLLGINIGPVGTPEDREEGVRVLGVTPDSAADAAGIRSGDVLLSIEGKRLDWSGDTPPTRKLLDHLATTEPGGQLKVEHRRDGQVQTVEVEARPRGEGFEFDFDVEELHRSLPPGGQAFVTRFLADRWGDMELVELTPGLGEYFETEEGVLVVRAPSDDTLGLQDGDVILDIAGRKPADPRHVVRILRSYEPGERLVMTVVRQGREQQLEADIPE